MEILISIITQITVFAGNKINQEIFYANTKNHDGDFFQNLIDIFLRMAILSPR
jgi:hypothetical protein